MIKRRYRIFISFTYITGDSWGYGNNTATIVRDKKYLSAADLREIEEKLRVESNFQDVVIKSYMFLW